jgi:hypothetical protein
MTKQFGNLTERDVLNLLKSQEMAGFFKVLAKIERAYELENQFFNDHIEDIANWQSDLPGGKINVKQDFIKHYKRMDKFDRADVQEKVLLHQPQRMKSTLKEFFRLLDASILTNKILPIEAFAQHLGLTFDELAKQLDRINWEDRIIEIKEEEPEGKDLKPPIHIENDFFRYYHQLEKKDKIDLQQRITQELPRKVRAKLENLFAWLDMNTKGGDEIKFEELVSQSEMHPQELIRYLDRVNWV